MATVNLPGIGAVDKRVLYGAGGLAGAFVLWRYWAAGRSSSTADEAVDAGAETTDGTAVDDAGFGVGTYVPPTITSGSGSYVAAGEGALLTDGDWVTESVNELAELGVDPSLATLALGKYLQGEGLTAAEREIVVRARALNGAPPVSGALPIKAATPTPTPGGGTTPKPPAKPPAKPPVKKPAPKPAPKPPVKKPAQKWVTVAKGDNLWEIATRNRTTLTALKRLNPSMFDAAHRGGDLIHPGERVRVK